MQLKRIVRALDLEYLTPAVESPDSLDFTAGHASDLLSDVLANAPQGSILVTIQVHMNVIAVALHAGIAAVVFASGMKPEKAVLDKAVEEKLPLYRSKEPTFNVAGSLYSLGIRGNKE
ncbi:MAG TPA: DRTGG domain-containing protein [Spirochaetia bacterium]|nr:DRTGG domain-containing protein [Spirochaetia bacterium]